jgi:hypothetical protein
MDYQPKQVVYLPYSDFLDLDLYLTQTRPGVTPEAFLTELLRRWLAVEKERISLRSRSDRVARGFQWKNVFLPDGTCLRTTYSDQTEFAKVIGEHIVSDEGEVMTPSLFANRCAKGRNAWRFVWLRFPGNDYWIRADDCRARVEEGQQRRSKTKISVL